LIHCRSYGSGIATLPAKDDCGQGFHFFYQPLKGSLVCDAAIGGGEHLSPLSISQPWEHPSLFFPDRPVWGEAIKERLLSNGRTAGDLTLAP